MFKGTKGWLCRGLKKKEKPDLVLETGLPWFFSVNPRSDCIWRYVPRSSDPHLTNFYTVSLPSDQATVCLG